MATLQASVLQVFILKYNLFLIIINGISDITSSQLNIFVDHTTIYPCFDSKSDQIDIELISDMTHSLFLIGTRIGFLMLTPQKKKKNLLSINHLKNSFLLPISKADANFQESDL